MDAQVHELLRSLSLKDEIIATFESEEVDYET